MDKNIQCFGDIFLNLTEPIKFDKDCILRLAESDEIPDIEQIVKNICLGFNNKYPYYDSYSQKYLYYVLQDSSTALDLAFCLSSVDATFITQNFKSGSYQEISYNHIVTATFFHDNPIKFVQWESSMIIEINKIANNINKLFEKYDLNPKSDYFFINKALVDFYRLKEISVKSPFKTLGIFAILELLLTHKPEPTKNLDDSLNHQLKSKLELLNKRFETPIDFNYYFPGSKFETIIAKLYNYRSGIAHGFYEEFKLKIIDNDMSQIFVFLYELLKKTLIQTIIEPDLIRDLQKC